LIKMKNCLLSLLIVVLISQSGIAAWSHRESDLKGEKPTPAYLHQIFSDEEWDAYPFASKEKMKWFNEARYGFFVHHGLSCLWAADISWSRETRAYPDDGKGRIPDAEYNGGINKLKMEHFDAEAIVNFAKDAGFKYIVVMAKHHDGFHLWDTKYSEHKITNSPFGRDYIREFADACHKLDMPIGVYYSQRDWFHPDYQPRLKETGKAGPRHPRYIEYMHNTVLELMTNYGKIDILWWDALWYNNMFTADMWDSDKIEREVRKLQPHIIINNRTALPGDFDTPEGRIGMFQKRSWETCMPLGSVWAWARSPIKSKKQIIRMLISTAGGNGNLLLSTGFMPDGKIDPLQKERMLEVGQWVKKYEHTICNTKGGPWYPGLWGSSTYRGNKVFLHIFKWPADGKLQLPLINQKIVSAKLLSSCGTVIYSYTPKTVDIEVAEADRDALDTIVELTLDQPVKGMSKTKELPSLFSDPVFGEIISDDATYTISSSDQRYDVAAEHFRLFKGEKAAKGYAFCTQKEPSPYIVIDLGKINDVTGIKTIDRALYDHRKKGLTVFVSEDGVKWDKVWSNEEGGHSWEIPITSFKSGSEHPGRKTRYIKLQANFERRDRLHLERVFVYGNK